MGIENSFAAEVFNAARLARIAAARGYPTIAAEQIHGALADLWTLDPHRAQAIADKYVQWVDDEPRPRSFAANVTPLR